MLKMVEISNGCFVEEHLARPVLQARAEKAQLAELKAWLADSANRSDINYSDIYKDVYGVRPRW